MKLFVIGASGMVGSRVVAEALARGHQVTGAARKPIAGLAGSVVLDATDADALTAAAKGADIIISASSPRSTGDAVAEAAALGRALVTAATALKVRVILVGGAGSLNLPDGSPVMALLPDFIVPEATGIRAVRDMLAASTLDWTYLAPAAEIAPGARTGQYRTGGTTLVADATGKSHISAEDFAVALLDEAENPKASRATQSVGY